ncbi:MAG TPA: GNAT family N-acetyltransferase [Longimicrobium sp.]
MIRDSIVQDSDALVGVGVEAGMFAPGETDWLEMLIAEYFDGKLGEGHGWITDEEQGEVRGVAYYAPAPASSGVSDLLMIAVVPGSQREGRGESLLRHVEDALRADGQRMLLVETSALPRYDQARAFYLKNGFEEEARIRDFYQPGEDKVVFRKQLGAA